MKTITTVLPIYNKIAKQCYERSKRSGNGIVPILCPRHRLPSFQWLDDTDGATSVTKIELIDQDLTATDITAKFTLPDMIPFAHDYFSYSGDTLLALLDAGLYYLKITMNDGHIYYSEWFKVECIFDDGLPPAITYSTKYLIINFTNSCDLGDILYQDGFTQTVFLESEPLEMSFPIEEEGQKNGEARFIRTFARQVKKYTARTLTLPDYMVDVFNRMILCNSITITDLVGDVHNVYNLEVEHEWMFADKYYVKLDLTFDYDESVVIGACCEI